MGRRKIEQRFLEERAGRLLAGLARSPGEPRGVMKVADPMITVNVKTKPAANFTVAAKAPPGGLSGILILHMEEAAASALELFLSFTEDSDLPERDRIEIAEETTKDFLELVLERAAESLSDMLHALLNESLLVLDLRTAHKLEGANESPPDDKVIRVALKHAEATTKRRMRARGRGSVPRVSLPKVYQAVMREGGEDAQAGKVAQRLSISARQLYNIHNGLGYSGPGGWRDFTGYVARLFDRK